MKKKSKIFFASLVVAFIGSVSTFFSRQETEISNEDLLFVENVLALSDQGTGGVACHCTRRVFGKNVCTANAGGALCGYGDCWNYDGNCRG